MPTDEPPAEILMEEEILAELDGDDSEGTRTIRVYDKTRGDFTLQIPRKSRVTFSYFNPAAAGDRSPNIGYERAGATFKTTALRIYEAGEKSPQLACFLGVEGFRDLSLKLTRLRQRVVIESNFEDDGDGNQNWGGKQQRMLNPAIEDEEIPF